MYSNIFYSGNAILELVWPYLASVYSVTTLTLTTLFAASTTNSFLILIHLSYCFLGGNMYFFHNYDSVRFNFQQKPIWLN